MRPLRLSQLAAWCQGQRIGAEDPELSSIAVDSREVQSGALFVALPGERVDGHDFVAAAQAAGAGAVMVQRELDTPLPQLRVNDAQFALGRIAAAMSESRSTRLLALTGSNGKTSVKTLLHGILQQHGSAYANPGNRNNELGLPLALIDQPEDAAFAVYEMGAGKPGDIAYLTEIAQPQVALVNNIGPAHLERLGSLLGVAQTKGAIYEALPVGGVAVINADDAFGRWFEDRLDRERVQVLRFGLQASAEVRALELRVQDAGSEFILSSPTGCVPVRLPLSGRHNVSNALAAAAMALAVDVPLATIAAALTASTPVQGRLQMHRLAGGARLIDDSYNANPASLAAAIAHLAALPAPRWLLLGDMRELGAEAEALHAEAGRQASAAGIERVYAVGELAAAAARAFGAGGVVCADQRELIAMIAAELRPEVNLLVKGSRGSRMDRVVTALLNPGGAGHAA